MFAETEDQQLFESATRRFLETHVPIDGLRELAGQSTTFDPSLWREAARLGWTTLLVPEEAGGGSISGNGLADLIIVAFQFGRHAAPGPLLGTNVVAAALGHWGSADQIAGPLKDLVAGDAVAAWAHTSTTRPVGTSGAGVAAASSGATVVLNGRVANVESAADARYLLVTADEPAGRTQYLVPLDTPGVELAPLRALDLTRRFSAVTLHDVSLPPGARVGEPGTADEHDARLLDLIVVMALGEIVGAVDRAFAMVVEWTANRYSFGRPLSSYQEIKHRIADMRTHLEASEAVTARAASVVGADRRDGGEWASAGMAYVGRYGPEVIQDCIQLHGGIGVTYDHDLHLFLRRAALDANLFGSPGRVRPAPRSARGGDGRGGRVTNQRNDVEEFAAQARGVAGRAHAAGGPVGRPLLLRRPPPRTDEHDLARIDRCRDLQRRLFDGGFAGICVPTEYGGQGLTPAHQFAFNRELRGYDYPLEIQASTFIPCMAILLEFGTEEQKQRHIPAMLRGEEVWAQFLSEPGGGSDAAGAVTTADHATATQWVAQRLEDLDDRRLVQRLGDVPGPDQLGGREAPRPDRLQPAGPQPRRRDPPDPAAERLQGVLPGVPHGRGGGRPRTASATWTAAGRS